MCNLINNSLANLNSFSLSKNINNKALKSFWPKEERSLFLTNFTTEKTHSHVTWVWVHGKGIIYSYAKRWCSFSRLRISVVSEVLRTIHWTIPWDYITSNFLKTIEISMEVYNHRRILYRRELNHVYNYKISSSQHRHCDMLCKVDQYGRS
jgi:hypothetical protein